MNPVVRRRGLAFLVAFVLAEVALACQVPVFRYALERWPADPYRIVAVVDGEAAGEVADAIVALQSIESSQVNVETEVINLAALSEAELWSIDGLEDTDALPLLQVFYPKRDGQERLCWSGPLTVANVNAWIESPLRHQIVQQIQSGASAVWVVVEGDDPLENDQLYEELQSALKTASETIAIPDGVIPRRDAARFLREHPTASMDDVLRCDIPLRIDFTAVRLAGDAEQEFAFRAMVDAWSPGVDAPFVFPVFGRGRMIEPLSAEAFDSSAVLTACRYMVGECSCSVKALNPGVDLILKSDWQATLGDQVVMVDVQENADPEPLVIPLGKGAQENDSGQQPSISEAESRPSGYWLIAIALIGIIPLAMKWPIRRS